MPEFGKLLAVYVAGITGLWKGIPTGIALDVDPIFTGLLTGLGSITSVLILYFAGENFRNWFFKHYGQKRLKNKKRKFFKFANKYGTWGLGLITSGLLGPFTSLFLGIVLLEDTKKFLYYLIAGLLLWSLLMAYFFTTMVDFIAQLKDTM